MAGDNAVRHILKGGLIRDVAGGTLYRVLYVSPDHAAGYWISVEPPGNIPKHISLADVGARLEAREYEAVIDQTCYEDEAALSQARIDERNRIYSLIKDIVSDVPSIFEPHARASILHSQEEKTGVGINKLYNYIGKFWRGGMDPNALLPGYDKRGKFPSGTTYARRTGRPKPEGKNGKILTPEDEEKFSRAIREHYSTDKKPTLTDTYSWMIAHMYTRPRFQGDTDPEQLPPDEKPSFRQFSYWHAKNKKPVEEQKKREGNRYELTSRGAVGKSETFVKGPGMAVQIDATIADYYLVRENHRNEVIGRPVMFFVKDVKTHMIMGMYVTLENTSWECAMMALKNTVEDKVEFCRRYGVAITEEEWPCRHLPVSITADNGEMGGSAVESVIARLGITIENAPPYRGDLKGIIEKNFEMVDLKLRYIVPGHVDRDDGQRGSINRKKEACIDIRTFIQMIIRCVIYYNNHHCMETYQRPPELVKAGVRPIPRDLWNYGMQFQSGALRIIRKEDIYRILLPRGRASVTDRGICFQGLYYTCEQARNESWFDKARISGRWGIPVNYDPTCLDHIYLSTNENTLIQCSLLDKSSAYQGFSEEDMGEALERDRQAQAMACQEEEKAKTKLILEIETLVERCRKEKKDGGAAAVGNVLDRHRLRDQRKAEKEEQSGEASARDAQASRDTEEYPHQDMFETAGDAMDNAIDEALRDAGVFDDEEG